MTAVAQQPATLSAWLYPSPEGYRLTIGEHLDAPLAIIAVRSYHEGRQLARLYDAQPRNF